MSRRSFLEVRECPAPPLRIQVGAADEDAVMESFSPQPKKSVLSRWHTREQLRTASGPTIIAVGRTTWSV